MPLVNIPNSSHVFYVSSFPLKFYAFLAYTHEIVCLFLLLAVADLQFEAPLKIVEYPDPILRAKNKRISTFDHNLKKLVDEMFDIMYR